MGDGKVEKSELHDFAREVGKRMADLNGRSHSLALMLDCMVAVLDNQSDLATAKFSDLLTAELDRRKKLVDEAVAKAKQEKEPTPLISVP